MIAFTTRVDDRDNIWILSLATGQPKQMTTNNNPKLRISSLAWSPDGKSIYYGKHESWTVVSMFDDFK